MPDPPEIDPEIFPVDPIREILEEILNELEIQKALLNDIKTNTGT